MNRTEEPASQIRKTIVLIREVIDLDEFRELKISDKDKYERDLTEMFPVFAEKFPALFGKAINEEDLSLLNIILNGHVKVSRGELTKEQGEEEIGKGVMNGIAYNSGF